jgi:hypothetical protein
MGKIFSSKRSRNWEQKKVPQDASLGRILIVVDQVLHRSPDHFLCSQTRPLPDLRDAHTSIRLPAHRDFVQPYSRIQARAKSVAAPFICADARNIEMLTDFQPVHTRGNLGVLARLLNARTEIRVSQRDAVFVAARSIDNLGGRDGTVGVNPVAPPPTEGGGRVGDLFAVAV